MNETTLKKLSLMDKNLIHKEDKNIDFNIVEKDEQGVAEVTIHHNNPCIIIEKLENNKLKYFTHPSCPDYCIFEFKNNSYILHVFELKTTISEKTFKKAKNQLKGGILHSLTFCGYLDINLNLKNIILYTAFKNDKLLKPKTSIEQRLAISSKNLRDLISEWNDDTLSFKLWEDTPFKFKHKKIQLDLETGKADYTL